jgi:hypothetical protein
MPEQLAGRRLTALVARGFEQEELLKPRTREDLEAALKGHTLAKARCMGRYERVR